MHAHREERQPLLDHTHDNIIPGNNQGSEYYDSFPSCGGSPDLTVTSGGSIQTGLPITSDNVEIKIYRRRWYIVIIFALFAFTQNGMWNTWGPISTSSEEAFDWDDATIAWLNNWGPIAYILVGLLFPWLLQVKGLRWAVLSSSLCSAIGTTMRVFTSEPPTSTILIHIGQFFNGLAGPIAMGACPAVSSVWFPPKERVTATALMVSIGYLGLATTFVLGPYLVSGTSNTTISTTSSPPTTAKLTFLEENLHFDFTQESLSLGVPDSVKTRERDDIMKYMYYQCGFAWLVTLCVLVYFPAKPPRAPCVSATVDRDEYWKGLWSLKSKHSFLTVAATYGVSLGVLNCWYSVLNVNLNGFVSENTAGWIGFYATIAACLANLLVARFADYFSRYMKFFILVLYVLGLVCFVVFTLVLSTILPHSVVAVYITIIAGNSFINAAVPLMFELACEMAYPTSEGAANGFLTYLNNIGGLIFLGIFAVPNIGTMWMNWALIGSTVACIPLIALLKGRFNRLEVDEQVHPESFVEQEIDIEEEMDADKMNV